jgi:hypothetical protein
VNESEAKEENRMKRWTIVSVVAFLLCSLSAEAQILTGNLIGVIRDESRAILPGATVTATSPALPGGPQTVVTNAQGEYRFTGLPPGVYELSVTMQGFRSYVEQDLRVSVGGTVERIVTLALGSVTEAVTVSGQAPVVDPRQAGLVKSLPAEAVEAIPHNRQGGVAAYMATLPGVTSGTYNAIGSVQVMGSATNETSYMSDGILTNSVTGGAAYGYLDQDAIEEMSMVTLGASVEYQQAQGGVMNMVTKAGTNRWRGDGLHYWAPPALTSAPIKLPCNCPEGETGYKLYKYSDFGYHAGGPIKKDRLWYYGGVSNAGPSARFPGAPETPKEHRWTRDEFRSNHKWTLKVSDKINFSQVFYYEWWHWSTPDFPTQFNPLETVAWYTGDIRAGASEMTATLTPSTVLTARYTVHSMPYGDVGFGPKFDKKDIVTPVRTDTFTGVQSGNYGPADALQPRRDDVAVKVNQYIPGSRVNHNVRFGFQWSRNKSYRTDVWPGGVEYRDNNGALNEARFIGPSYDATQADAQGLWGEDEITFGNRLTIIPAVRFDRMKAISPDARVVDPTQVDLNGGLCRCVIAFPRTGDTIPGLGDLFTWTKISPRFGLTYKLTDDGKTIMRATAGRYYRPIFLSEFSGGSAIHPGVATQRLMGYNAATGGFTTLLSITDPRSNLAIDPDIRAPYTDQYSLGIDRELARNIGASISYVHKEGRDQIGWRDIGSTYGEQTVTAPDGQTITVFPRTSAASQQRFLRTNGPGFYSTYNGVMMGVTRRMANRWMANFGYSYSITEGLWPGGTTGRDPNDLINRDGRLPDIDRPHLFNAAASYEIPRIEVQLSGNLTLTQGRPFGAVFQTRLPQGLRNIYFEEPGSHRRPNQRWLHLRVNKILFRRGARYIEVGAELRNALQQTNADSLITELFSSPNFGLPSAYATPRQMMFRVRGYW